ncbi:isochorismatase family protein [Egicoccus sp. AB-alg2]|uniref:isochorismatase family protein n=1 Tax=Egicoccus sp. AB-alg2 TaxID=3242693 RepID=UPI00359EE97F
MESSALTARELYEQHQRSRTPRFGIGDKVALVNVDLQRAYTGINEFATAYETDPRQLDHVVELAGVVRALGGPVVWTYVAYEDSGADCGVWGTRSDTPDSLQNIKVGSRRSELDERLDIHDVDVVMRKRMPSAFFETNLPSLLTWHRVDTVIVTGGSTSGCVRATAVDSLSHGYRTIVPEECVADKHESPHFASLYDLSVKYADVTSTTEVLAGLRSRM